MRGWDRLCAFSTSMVMTFPFPKRSNKLAKKRDDPPWLVPVSITSSGFISEIVSWITQRSKMFCQIGLPNHLTEPKFPVARTRSPKNRRCRNGIRKRLRHLLKGSVINSEGYLRLAKPKRVGDIQIFPAYQSGVSIRDRL